MDSKECSDDPLFVVLVELLHNLNPSANSAYYLGLLNDKKNNSEEALRFYNESIELQTDNIKNQQSIKVHNTAKVSKCIQILLIFWKFE